MHHVLPLKRPEIWVLLVVLVLMVVLTTMTPPGPVGSRLSNNRASSMERLDHIHRDRA